MIITDLVAPSKKPAFPICLSGLCIADSGKLLGWSAHEILDAKHGGINVTPIEEITRLSKLGDKDVIRVTYKNCGGTLIVLGKWNDGFLPETP